jgi:hypothetical protein
MPVFEAHIRSFEVDEKIVGIKSRDCAGGAVRQRLGWWRLSNTIVDEMAGKVSLVQNTIGDILPVYGRDCIAERLLNLWCLQRVNIAVKTARLLHCGNTASHPLRTTNQFVI